eukprot:5086349-Pyramimonas_sp.AAC.1
MCTSGSASRTTTATWGEQCDCASLLRPSRRRGIRRRNLLRHSSASKPETARQRGRACYTMDHRIYGYRPGFLEGSDLP